MAESVDKVLTKILTERGHVSQETLDPLIMKAAQASGGLAQFLVKRGVVSEDVVLDILSEHFHIPRIDLTNAKIEKNAIEKVPRKIAEYYRFLPVKLEHGKLVAAVPSPCDLRTQDEIRTHLGIEITMLLAPEQTIVEAIQKWYGLAAGTIEEIMQAQTAKEEQAVQAEAEEEKVENIETQGEEASVIRLVNQILFDAYTKGATDIHIEPYRGKIKIRYRVDGVLQNTNVPPEIKRFFHAIVSRIKIMSSLNIIEKRVPQDGRAIVKVSDDNLDLRISSIPTPYGESIVIRLLPLTRVFSLEQLGLEKEDLDKLNMLIRKPHGIIYMTGPTGSGKSTTLYAALSMINTDERKIITLEDPVEHELEGATQIQMVPQVGLTFAAGLRSVLRHDPDVIMVGEVRDFETAETAARVALTGHLVFSTLHTNDAAGGITRLIDMGVPPYLVSSSIEAFIAQRLVRTICSNCKEEDQSPEAAVFRSQIARELRLGPGEKIALFKGRGCPKCSHSGYKGRVAILEILVMDEEIRDLVMKRVPTGEIARAAVSRGMRTLRQSGWAKAIKGMTTPEEVIRVAEKEGKDESEGSEISEKDSVEEGVQKPRSRAKETASLKEPGASDRRTYARLAGKANVRYRKIDPNSPEGKSFTPEKLTVTKNVSAGGLLIYGDEPLPVGALVELKAELPDERNPVECLARVVRVSEVDFEETYELAVCFLDLSSADRGRLNKFIEEGE